MKKSAHEYLVGMTLLCVLSDMQNILNFIDYSTVTTLARLRGLSTLTPFSIAR